MCTDSGASDGGILQADLLHRTFQRVAEDMREWPPVAGLAYPVRGVTRPHDLGEAFRRVSIPHTGIPPAALATEGSRF